jgi:hypothetical protein
VVTVTGVTSNWCAPDIRVDEPTADPAHGFVRAKVDAEHDRQRAVAAEGGVILKAGDAQRVDLSEGGKDQPFQSAAVVDHEQIDRRRPRRLVRVGLCFDRRERCEAHAQS